MSNAHKINTLSTVWVRRKGLFELNPERPSFYIRTNGATTENMWNKYLRLYHTYNNTEYGMSITVGFGSWDFEMIYSCWPTRKKVYGTLHDVPDSYRRVWKITKHVESISVECNAVEVLEQEYQEYFDEGCMDIIRGNVSYFGFTNTDTASDEATTGKIMLRQVK